MASTEKKDVRDDHPELMELLYRGEAQPLDVAVSAARKAIIDESSRWHEAGRSDIAVIIVDFLEMFPLTDKSDA